MDPECWTSNCFAASSPSWMPVASPEPANECIERNRRSASRSSGWRTNSGRPLLNRTGKQVAPAEHGERLLSYARRLLALAEEARDVLARPGNKGAVRLGIPQDFAAFGLTNLLATFARSITRSIAASKFSECSVFRGRSEVCAGSSNCAPRPPIPAAARSENGRTGVALNRGRSIILGLACDKVRHHGATAKQYCPSSSAVARLLTKRNRQSRPDRHVGHWPRRSQRLGEAGEFAQ